MNITHTFSIAELTFKTISDSQEKDILQFMPSFLPFQADQNNKKPLFQLTITQNLGLVPQNCCERIHSFDFDNGNVIVDYLNDGGYQYIIKDTYNHLYCLLQTDKDFTDCKCTLSSNREMQERGLNDALMFCFAFAGSRRKTLLIHASLIRNQGYGYAFIAKSGTGKSTHAALWLNHIKGCDLINDDNPVIRIIEGHPYIFGSPWSGKTPCYRNVKAKLGAITHIERAQKNEIKKLSLTEAFAALLSSCSTMKWDKCIYDHTCDTIANIIQMTGIYNLRCLPDQEAALVAYQAIRKA